jgi:hypothetical protein
VTGRAIHRPGAASKPAQGVELVKAVVVHDFRITGSLQGRAGIERVGVRNRYTTTHGPGHGHCHFKQKIASLLHVLLNASTNLPPPFLAAVSGAWVLPHGRHAGSFSIRQVSFSLTSKVDLTRESRRGADGRLVLADKRVQEAEWNVATVSRQTYYNTTNPPSLRLAGCRD